MSFLRTIPAVKASVDTNRKIAVTVKIVCAFLIFNFFMITLKKLLIAFFDLGESPNMTPIK